MQITAAVTASPGAAFTLESVELDAPRPDEILVRIKAVGVCHTDLVAREGAMPFSMPAVLGHEGAGIVERVGLGGSHEGGARRPGGAHLPFLWPVYWPV